ncbi:glycosyltransferase [Virgibacillus dokdonensis]|nr:glycosyltransferase [Virgibacillus dokdonensis]
MLGSVYREEPDMLFRSLSGEKVLLIGVDDVNEIKKIAKQGFTLTVIEDTKKAKTEKKLLNTPRVKMVYGDILTYKFSEKFDSVIIQNNIEHYINVKFLFDKIFSDVLESNGRVILNYDTELEFKHLFTPKIMQYFNDKDIYINTYSINGNKTFIKLSQSKDNIINFPRIIECVELAIVEILKKETKDMQNSMEKHSRGLPNSNASTNNSYEQYNKLLSKYNEIVQTNKQVQLEMERHKGKVQELRSTVRYKIGDEFVKSLKNPGRRTLKLPFTLFNLLREGKENEKARLSRKRKNIVSVEKSLTPSSTLNNEQSGSIVIEKIKNTEIYHKPSKIKNFENLKVVCILDEFSYQCFNSEANFYQLSYKSWKEQIDDLNPHFLFVESAWLGENEEWRYKLINLQNQKDPQITKLVNYCKSKSIPTVFWNKEDPPNFDRFIETAKLFDYIFTTEVNVIDRYKQIVGHNNVQALPFAAQPTIHNPVNVTVKDKSNVAFAGTWYANRHFERQTEMNNLLSPARNYNLEIYDRFYDFTDNNNYKFPDIYREFIVGKLDYEDMIKAYRLYSVFLNVNSVSNSETMFSRRVFEILASGTNVISSYSLGIEKLFKDIVLISSSESDTKDYLDVLLNNNELLRRRAVKGVREVYSNHLYAHRLETILSTIDLEYESIDDEGVTVVTVTMRPDFLENVLYNYSQQTWENKELIIVLNGENFDTEEVNSKTKNYANVKVINSASSTLGACLNKAIENAEFNVIAKFDDDDYYGPNYLTDSMQAFVYTDASIIGKKSIYMYFEDTDMLVLKYPNTENKFQTFVYGATLVFKKEVWEANSFSDRNRGEDSAFLKNAISNGFKIFSTNPYNYVYIRRSYAEHHTWEVNNYHLMRKSEIVGYMKDYISHATV